jgi:hypothetical protein
MDLLLDTTGRQVKIDYIHMVTPAAAAFTKQRSNGMARCGRSHAARYNHLEKRGMALE